MQHKREIQLQWQPRRLQQWLGQYLDIEGAISVNQIHGPISNDNYSVDWGVHRWLLRKSPAVLSHQSAHNVLREYRILKALETTAVRAPHTIIACDDRSIIGSAFYIMERVNGIVTCRTLPAPYSLIDNCVDTLAVEMINALVVLHNVDWQAVKLGDIGKTTGYLEQQVGRWLAQHQAQSCGEFPSIVALSTWLRENRPVEQKVSLIHGDYQLGNLIISRQPPARLLAIIDWELTTLGDPLMDLASALLSWPTKGNTYVNSLLAGGRAQRGSARFEQLAQRYGQATGLDMSSLNYYLVLAAWKRAIILESRYGSLQKNPLSPRCDSKQLDQIKTDIELLLEQASWYVHQPIGF
jgi:aminoglycoside phosphotransferase (APT) family kinase protein